MGTVSCKSEMPTTAGTQMIATQAASLPAKPPVELDWRSDSDFKLVMVGVGGT